MSLLLAGAFILGLLTVSCTPGDADNLEKIEDLPIRLAERISPSGWVLFQDDFSDPSSGWEISADPESRREYYEGVFRFSILRPRWNYWSTPGLEFSDIHVDAQIRRLGGDGVSSAGIICRYQDEGNYYAFVITSDGYTGISKVEGGQEKLLGRQTLSPSKSVYLGDTTNFIGADCIGDRLVLWVNGTQALEVRDGSFQRGEAGMVVSVLDGRGAVLEFDNFSVLKP
jgi:hypothetical protein